MNTIIHRMGNDMGNVGGMLSEPHVLVSMLKCFEKVIIEFQHNKIKA